MCGDGARVIRVLPRVIQQLGFWTQKIQANVDYYCSVSYTHLRAHETPEHLVCRLLLEKKITRGAWARLSAAKLELSQSRLGCLSPGPREVHSLGAAPDIAVVDVGLNFLSPKT